MYLSMADEVEEIFILRYIAIVFFISCFFRKGVTMDQPAADFSRGTPYLSWNKDIN